MQMSNKSITRLWKITLLLVLLLLVATIGLAVQARNQPVIGVEAQINKRFFMREGPQGVARISAVLRQGTVVTIIDSVQQGSTIWYQIEIGELTGWVPSDAAALTQAVTIRE